MTTPNLLIIGGKDSSVEWLGALGCRADLVQSPGAATPRQRAAACALFEAVPGEVGRILDFAAGRHRASPYDAMACFQEPWLLTAAAVGDALGLRMNPRDAVETACDKARLRERLAGTELDRVPFRRCASAADLRAFLAEVGGPVVAKPTGGSGSRGVSLLRGADQVDAAWAHSLSAEAGEVIAEAFVEGPEYSVESMTRDGRHEIVAITEKLTTGAPYFVELGHRMPAPLDPATAARVRRATARLLDAIGHAVGPAHTELRLRDGEPVVIETQTRFGGDQIWELAQLTTGVSFARETIAHLIGRRPDPLRPAAPAAAIRFLPPPGPGIVGAVAGAEEAAAMPGIVRVAVEVAPGRATRALTSSRDRCGYVLALGDDPDQAAARAEAALARLAIELQPAAA